MKKGPESLSCVRWWVAAHAICAAMLDRRIAASARRRRREESSVAEARKAAALDAKRSATVRVSEGAMEMRGLGAAGPPETASTEAEPLYTSRLAGERARTTAGERGRI